MDMDAVYAALKNILTELRLVDMEKDIHGFALLGRGGVMDSLTAMRFVSAVESRFDVDILGDVNLDCMETTDSLAAYIACHAPHTSPAVAVGKHLVIDCDNCPRQSLTDLEAVRALVHALADGIGTTILQENYHGFSPAGVTGFAIVSASHIAVHTWPEYGYMGVDIFSCKDVDPEKITSLLKRVLGSVRCAYRLLERTANGPDGIL